MYIMRLQTQSRDRQNDAAILDYTRGPTAMTVCMYTRYRSCNAYILYYTVVYVIHPRGSIHVRVL